MALIEVQGVHKVYRNGRLEVHALRGVDLVVEAGEFVSIMGPSGSGKSTLMNVLGCLDRPTRGVYRLAGQAMERAGDSELADLRNQRLGFVFQTYNLLPPLTARQNVELPLVYRGLPGRERRRRADAALAAVGLSHRAGHRPAELSGGEQQRVAIARALAGEPAVILADEPTGNLDSRTGEEIMHLFQQLNDERGITVIQVTHDRWIAEHSRRVVLLRDGVVVNEEEIARPVRAREVLAEGSNSGAGRAVAGAREG